MSGGRSRCNSSWARRFAVPTGAMLCLSVIFVCLAGLPQAAKAQTGGDRWVTLATREIDAKAGRASIDLSKARGRSGPCA